MRQRRAGHQRAPAKVQRRDRALRLVRSQAASLTRSLPQLRQDIRAILRAGVEAVDAAGLVRAALAGREIASRCARCQHVVAAGKAAGPMFTAAADAIRTPNALVATHSTTPYRWTSPVERFDAGHPAPNAASVEAGERALTMAAASRSVGGLLVLLSGGASAMLAAPATGITLGEKTETGLRLMQAGAPIHELNCVRKHLSRIKGGRLAAAAGRTVTLALSDVHAPIPDDPSVIGSGPTVPDDTTFADALDVVERRRVGLPPSVLEHLRRGSRAQAEETIKPGDRRILESVYVVVGNRDTAVDGARQAAEARGYTVVRIEAATAGEAREAARAFVQTAAGEAVSAGRPLCLLASGETTVTVRGDGLGGRNQEFALSVVSRLADLGVALDRAACLASAGTDGVDGPTDAAGAVVDSRTLHRAGEHGLHPDAFLTRNDAYRFFDALGDLIRWGPTGTNVGDLHVMLIG